MKFYPELLIAPLISFVPIGLILYFIIYFAVLNALKKYKKM